MPSCSIKRAFSRTLPHSLSGSSSSSFSTVWKTFRLVEGFVCTYRFQISTIVGTFSVWAAEYWILRAKLNGDEAKVAHTAERMSTVIPCRRNGSKRRRIPCRMEVYTAPKVISRRTVGAAPRKKGLTPSERKILAAVAIKFAVSDLMPTKQNTCWSGVTVRRE